ncbi:MAG: bacterial Ig-like domain-containing protein, partial [Clostridia bacterium]|nr:bacterial Ig-like domain-containing protein [Clostridia bacterium]
MKKFAKIALVLLMLVICVCAVVACDGNQKINTTIEISNENMPQTVFVKGNELDLSAGKIKVSGKEDTEIALNSEGVVVTGYDKDTLGVQTLTVTYQGASTTFDVKVVERIASGDKFTKEYVIGEQFDTLTGKLVITKDNGESFDIATSDSKLTFSGFDSQTAGVKSVNVVYKDDQIEYTGKVSVTVYEIDRITFNKMHMKTDYNSHDTELDLGGGHFVVTAKGGTIQNKYIYLNDSMVKTELDTSLVNEEHPTETQVINIEFGGHKASFTITITLTDVTRIQNAAKSLASLDWSGNSACNVTDEQGALAVNAYMMYTKLDDKDKAFINDNQIMSIVRPAVVYANKKWIERADEFSALFRINSSTLRLNCESYEQTKQKFEVISALEKTDILFEYGDMFADIAKKYEKTILFGDTTIVDYLENVCAGTDVSHAIEMIDLMLKMHAALQVVPTAWEVSDLAEYDEAIEATRALVIELGELRDELIERYVFKTVSKWREKNDFVDILYRYYYSLYQSKDFDTQVKGVQAIESMFNSCMPDALDDFVMQFIAIAMQQGDIVYSSSEAGFVPSVSINTFAYIVSYRNLLQMAEDIRNSDDEMIAELFDIFQMESRIIETLQTAKFGIFQILGVAYGDEAFDNMWTKYIDTVNNLANTDLNDEEIKAIAKDLFETFSNLTFELQMQFLASLNPYGTPEFIPSDGTNRRTLFTDLFLTYCYNYLPGIMQDDEKSMIVWQLFDAIQNYMLREEEFNAENGSVVTGLSLFLSDMSGAKTIYSSLSADDKNAFDDCLGFLYEKYLHIYGLYDTNGKFIEQTISDEWKEVLDNFDAMYLILNTFLESSISYSSMYPLY